MFWVFVCRTLTVPFPVRGIGLSVHLTYRINMVAFWMIFAPRLTSICEKKSKLFKENQLR